MFGFLKKKLSKAIESITKKLEKKEEKTEELEKKLDQAVEQQIETIETPVQETPKPVQIEEPILEPEPIPVQEPLPEPEIEIIKEPEPEPEIEVEPAQEPIPTPTPTPIPTPIVEPVVVPEPVVEEKVQQIEEKIEETIEDIIDDIEEQEPEIEIKKPTEDIKQEIKEETKKIAEEIKKIKEQPQEQKEEKKSLIRGLISRVTKRIVEKKLTEEELKPVLIELENDLIESDVAVEVAERIKNNLLNDLVGKEIKRGQQNTMIVESFKNSLIDILSVPDINLKDLASKKKPVVIIFLGFNGSGKTTSIAKVANWLKKNNYTCVLAAADTFRAASIEQLQEHADKIGVKMIKHKYGADPAAVVYDAVEHAKAKKLDFVLADTAGRVHTNDDLMKEMKKIVRVNQPDIKVLVIDSLTGNDAIHQARSFGQFGVDATIFTKVDVNEKGGAILSVTNELKKPILFLGLGQEYDDFERFEPQKFVDRVLK